MQRKKEWKILCECVCVVVVVVIVVVNNQASDERRRAKKNLATDLQLFFSRPKNCLAVDHSLPDE
jgi:hypothetical protein